ncbi:MAG: MFS transporter [Cyclobacteriaceae bacterium]
MSYLNIIRKHPNFLSYGMLHYFFSSIGQTFLISVSVPFMLTDLDISSGNFSNAYAVATLSSAFLLPLAGKWVDRLSLRLLSLLGGLGLVLASIVMFQVDNLVLLIFGLFLLRFFGQGSMILIGSTAIARFFSSNRGKALSVSSLGLAFAETLTPLLFVWLIAQYGWQTSWLFPIGAVLLVFIPVTQFLILRARKEPDSANEDFTNNDNDFTVKQMFRDPRFYMILPAFAFLPFFITGIFIHQNMLASAKGWTMEWMAACFIGFGIAKVLTSFMGGWLVDKFSAKSVFSFYLIPMALGLLLLLFLDHRLVGVFYMILIGITASLGSLTGVAIWAELYGVKNLGAIKSMVTMMMVVATAIGPIVIGWGFEQSLNYTLMFSIGFILVTSLVGRLGLSQNSFM